MQAQSMYQSHLQEYAMAEKENKPTPPPPTHKFLLQLTHRNIVIALISLAAHNAGPVVVPITLAGIRHG